MRLARGRRHLRRALAGVFALMLLLVSARPAQPAAAAAAPGRRSRSSPTAVRPRRHRQIDDDPDKGDPKKLPYPLVQDLRPAGLRAGHPRRAAGQAGARPARAVPAHRRSRLGQRRAEPAATPSLVSPDGEASPTPGRRA